MVSLEQLIQSLADKYATIDEHLRLLTIHAINVEIDRNLDPKGELCAQARAILTDIALDVGDSRAEDLRKLFKEKLSEEFPDLEKATMTALLKRL